MGKLQPGGPDDDHQAELRRVIGEIAHELSRPLAAVLNYAELALLDPDLSESTRARLGKVLEHAEACRQVVFHSLEIDAATPRSFGPVDLNAAVRRAAASLPQAVGRDDSPLVLDLHPALARVEGSARDLEAAVRNLLENALEATDAAPPGRPPPRVEVTTAPTKAGVRLTVRDNGPGLDPRIADHVFEPFVSTKDTDQATGLGLSIVRRIILDHRGQVAAGSAPEGGAVFTVDPPARAATPGRPARARPKRARVPRVRRPRTGARRRRQRPRRAPTRVPVPTQRRPRRRRRRRRGVPAAATPPRRPASSACRPTASTR